MAAEDPAPPPKRPYGLSFASKPKSQTNTTLKLQPIHKGCLAAAAFSVDDDDDDAQINVPISKTKKLPALNPKAQRDIEQALEEDPNIYEYDEVYEQVSSTVQQEQKREEKRRLERESNTVRQPKYVAGLLEKSKQREKEYERVKERQIQRERELEGDLYADKEVFVTAAYKVKLAERQADLAREKLEDKREALLNVLQQDNMDAFYRFQFKVRTGDVTILEESEKVKTEPSTSAKPESFASSNDRLRQTRQLRSRADNDDEPMDTNASTDNDEMYARAREKHVRSIQREQPKEVKEEPIAEEVPLPSSSSSSIPAGKPVKVRRINDETSKVFDDEQIEMGVGPGGKKKKAEKKKGEEKPGSTKENDLELAMPIAGEKKRLAEETRIERIRRLCEKRTVGEVLETAKQAYYARQERREQLKDYIERAE